MDHADSRPQAPLPRRKTWPRDISLAKVSEGMEKFHQLVDEEHQAEKNAFPLAFPGFKYVKTTPSVIKDRFIGYGDCDKGLYSKFAKAVKVNNPIDTLAPDNSSAVLVGEANSHVSPSSSVTAQVKNSQDIPSTPFSAPLLR